MRLLMELPAPDARVKRAVHGAMKWFDRYKLTGLKCERIVLANGERDTRLVEDPQAKPIWARYYDLKYCDRMYVTVMAATSPFGRNRNRTS